MRDRVILAWSGGKDSSLALYKLKNKYEINALITTVTKDYNRISMHGVRVNLLKAQAESLGLPLQIVFIRKNSTNEEYERAMRNIMMYYKGRGIEKVAFGDIFLEDVRRYRENNLKKIDMTALFPLWGEDTHTLAEKFIKLGFKAIVTAIDSKFLDKKFVGRSYNEQFLEDLPDNVDPCGENGEFHTFVYDGPIFKTKMEIKIGKVVQRGRFYYRDLL